LETLHDKMSRGTWSMKKGLEHKTAEYAAMNARQQTLKETYKKLAGGKDISIWPCA